MDFEDPLVKERQNPNLYENEINNSSPLETLSGRKLRDCSG
jgi:hypothetical protein